ncbi:MAG: diphosphate--fructose-6-phosphate 1-phosphotransferase [Chloroflexota bacterium]
MASSKRVGILCGGGPAPGMNSVIGAATIRSVLGGVDVLGIHDGFGRLMRGDIDCATRLSIEDVSRIHFAGGSQLGTSRANPTRDPQHMQAVSDTLHQLGINALITIGGDDTAYSVMRLADHAGGWLQVVHVPKTIDNDLDLPHGIPTFGFQTARHVGVGLVKNLMTDAKTTGRWYLIVAMGRTAGHLALGIGKAAGATLTIISEEFPEAQSQGGGKVRLEHLTDIVLGAIVKRKALHHDDGTVILAEGLVEQMASEDLEAFGQLERDEHDHIRLAEVNLGDVLRTHLRSRLAEVGLHIGLVSKDIGYELRCADPIPFDMEYTRDLGYCAAQYVLDGGTNAMVTLVNGHFVSMPFDQMLDPQTRRTRVRLVDPHSEHYRIARGYMVRLEKQDFEDEGTLRTLASTIGQQPSEFEARFKYLVANELSDPARARAGG